MPCSKLADEGGQFFFLEASSPSSRALYARYGFADYKQASAGWLHDVFSG